MPTMTRAGYTPPQRAPEKKPSAPPKKRKKKARRRAMSAAAWVSVAVFALAVLVGGATLWLYSVTQPYADAFLPGTMLGGYPLAGLGHEDASRLLGRMAGETADSWQIELAWQGTIYRLTAQDAGLSIDEEATLEPLWAAGREGGMLARLAAMRTLSQEPLIVWPVVTCDQEAIDAWLSSVSDEIECDPVDATVTFVPGSAIPFRFTDEQTGLCLDMEPIRAQIARAIQRLEPLSVELSPQELQPNAYRAVLENSISLRSRVTLTLDAQEGSVHNARQAAAMLDGLAVGAGETLSFNDIVGRRTQESGYVAAPEPAYGANESGVGGGVCQVSTALYQAALLGDIEVAQRSPAARPVGFCGMGQEAVVSDQGLDLVLRNPTDTPLFVMTRVYEDEGGTMLELSLIGEPLDQRYALESQSRQTGTIEEPVYVRDRDGQYATYIDERVPVSDAQPGYAATVERVTLDADGAELARETISEDTYDATAPVIYVGVNPREQ
ncbi:MAG: VanW family protein [Candidatus Ventricola sp.]